MNMTERKCSSLSQAERVGCTLYVCVCVCQSACVSAYVRSFVLEGTECVSMCVLCEDAGVCVFQ